MTASIISVAEEVGPRHGVVANAAILPPPVPVEQLHWPEWHQVLNVNLTGAVSTLVSSLAHVVEGGSLLINGSSMAIHPRARRLAYVAATAGLHAVARALALELAPRRTRVNVVAPDRSDTPMARRIPGQTDSGPPSVPLNDLVPAEEVAALAVDLRSGDGLHVTGAVFSVDGGCTAG